MKYATLGRMILGAVVGWLLGYYGFIFIAWIVLLLLGWWDDPRMWWPLVIPWFAARFTGPICALVGAWFGWRLGGRGMD